MKKSILVVDDEPDIVKTVAIALELLGYEVNTAATGLEARDKICCCPPDLVIMDIVIPGMNGRELSGWIKSRPEHKHIPIILITALAQKREEEAIGEAEIDCCLIKPFDLEQLEVKVQALLGTTLSNAQP